MNFRSNHNARLGAPKPHTWCHLCDTLPKFEQNAKRFLINLSHLIDKPPVNDEMSFTQRMGLIEEQIRVFRSEFTKHYFDITPITPENDYYQGRPISERFNEKQVMNHARHFIFQIGWTGDNIRSDPPYEQFLRYKDKVIRDNGSIHDSESDLTYKNGWTQRNWQEEAYEEARIEMRNEWRESENDWSKNDNDWSKGWSEHEDPRGDQNNEQNREVIEAEQPLANTVPIPTLVQPHNTVTSPPISHVSHSVTHHAPVNTQVITETSNKLHTPKLPPPGLNRNPTTNQAAHMPKMPPPGLDKPTSTPKTPPPSLPKVTTSTSSTPNTSSTKQETQATVVENAVGCVIYVGGIGNANKGYTKGGGNNVGYYSSEQHNKRANQSLIPKIIGHVIVSEREFYNGINGQPPLQAQILYKFHHNNNTYDWFSVDLYTLVVGPQDNVLDGYTPVPGRRQIYQITLLTRDN